MTAKDQVTERDVVAEALSDEHYDRAMLHVVKRMVQQHVVVPRVFGDAVQSIQWEEKSAGFYVEVIQMALEIEAISTARGLADQGHERFPDHQQLANAVRVLAPPKVIGRGTGTPSMKQTMEWVRQNASQYRGQWIAVRRGELIGTHQSHDQLMEGLDESVFDRETLVTRIP